MSLYVYLISRCDQNFKKMLQATWKSAMSPERQAETRNPAPGEYFTSLSKRTRLIDTILAVSPAVCTTPAGLREIY